MPQPLLTPHQSQYFAWLLTRRAAGDSVESLASTLVDAQVDLNPLGNRTITVQGAEIAIATRHEQDYICLTDMLKAKDGGFFISDWLRNRNTVEFPGIWESLSNPDFNYGEFAIIRLRKCVL